MKCFAFSQMSMDEENSDRMTSLESRMLSVAQGYEADLSTKALQLQFQTLNSCWKSVISQVSRSAETSLQNCRLSPCLASRSIFRNMFHLSFECESLMNILCSEKISCHAPLFTI